MPAPPNVPLLRALWSLSVGIYGILNGSWGVPHADFGFGGSQRVAGGPGEGAAMNLPTTSPHSTKAGQEGALVVSRIRCGLWVP